MAMDVGGREGEREGKADQEGEELLDSRKEKKKDRIRRASSSKAESQRRRNGEENKGSF